MVIVFQEIEHMHFVQTQYFLDQFIHNLIFKMDLLPTACPSVSYFCICEVYILIYPAIS